MRVNVEVEKSFPKVSEKARQILDAKLKPKQNKIDRIN